jgi:hypothetical protein
MVRNISKLGISLCFLQKIMARDDIEKIKTLTGRFQFGLLLMLIGNEVMTHRKCRRNITGTYPPPLFTELPVL